MKEKSRKHMDALQARALLFQRKLAESPVDWSIPGLPELDNRLSIIELPADGLKACANLATIADGTVDNTLAMAASVCKSLVLRETKERIFSDTDIEAVASFGTTVLKPLSDVVEVVSGLSANSLAEAKKNLKIIPESDSSISSVPSSEGD